MGLFRRKKGKHEKRKYLHERAPDYIVRSIESKRLERPPTRPEYRKELTEAVIKVLNEIIEEASKHEGVRI
ncbi:MAG: hypothetical protein R3251_03095 [Candidatus Spechtbacterales bacterium]|nr:hypothetical protein [Candidatus Spechtbacterales bacterium]